MRKVKLPRIPRGNLGKVYVLSEKAANELFRESSEIVRERWPLSTVYNVPSAEGTKVTLESNPSLWLPRDNRIGEGRFEIRVSYVRRNTNGSGLYTGCSETILEFLCESKEGESDATPSRIGLFLQILMY